MSIFEKNFSLFFLTPTNLNFKSKQNRDDIFLFPRETKTTNFKYLSEMEVYKNFIVFPFDYKSEIIFLSTEEAGKTWTFEVDWDFPLNNAKPKGFLDLANDEDEENQNKTNVGKPEENGIHLIAISEANDLLAFTTNEKSIFLCKIEENDVKVLSRRLFFRTASTLSFSSCGKMIFLADKTGDVFEYSCDDLKAPGKYILGHISQILDLKVSHE